MAVSSSVLPWTLRMPAGSQQQWTFTLTTQTPSGYTPYPIPGGATWEYVVRGTPTDIAGSLLSVTTTVTASGQITVISTAVLSQVTLSITATATVGLVPGTYYHCLWMQPSTPSALAVFDGLLLVDGAPAA